MTGINVNREMQESENKRLIAISIVILALIVYSYHIRFARPASPSLPDLERIPTEILGFASEERSLPREEIEVLGVDESLVRIYRNRTGEEITLLIGYFKTQQENSQIHSPKHCYPGSGWDVTRERTAKLTLSGQRENVKYLLISNGRQKRLVLYWFENAHRIITNEFALKWYEMKNAFLGRSHGVAFIRFSIDITGRGNVKESLKELMDFAEKASESIEDVLSAKENDH
ncbi:EpsI family protein [bacterium]|nr:MAG: EpsI family protein [bacterium]